MILSLYLLSSRFLYHLENKIQTSHYGLQAYMSWASLVSITNHIPILTALAFF